jgi:hypothetical protein
MTKPSHTTCDGKRCDTPTCKRKAASLFGKCDPCGFAYAQGMVAARLTRTVNTTDALDPTQPDAKTEEDK